MTEQIPIPTLHPTMRMLSDEQIRAIHSASLDILSRTGIVMKNEVGRELLLEAGAWESGDRIKIPEHPGMADAISCAPSRIPMHNRLGELTMPLEEGKVFFGLGSDCPFTMDLETGERRQPVARRRAAHRPPVRRPGPDRLCHVDGHAHPTCRPWTTICTALSP